MTDSRATIHFGRKMMLTMPRAASTLPQVVAVLTICIAVASAPTIAQCPAIGWTLGTQMDNTSITRMIVDGTPILLLPAGTTMNSAVHVLAYSGGTWTNAATLPVPSGSYTTLQGCPDTDRIITWTPSSPATVDFHQLINPGGNWQWASNCTADIPPSTVSIFLKTLAPTCDGAVIQLNSTGYHYNLLRCGLAPADLGTAGDLGFLGAARWTASGIILVRRQTMGSNYQITVVLYDSSTATPITSTLVTLSQSQGYWTLQDDGFWYADNGISHRLGLPSLTEDRTLNVQPNRPLSILSPPGLDTLMIASVPGARYMYARFDNTGTMQTCRPTTMTNLVEQSADNRFVRSNSGQNGELLFVSTGATMNRSVFTYNDPSRGNTFVTTPDGRSFYSKARFFLDAADIRELHPQRGPWESPGSPLWLVNTPVVDFGVVPIGSEATENVRLRGNGPVSLSVNLLVEGANDLCVNPFSSSLSAANLSNNATVDAPVSYNPTQSGPEIAFLRSDTFYINSSDPYQYEVTTLVGRTSSTAQLGAALRGRLDGYARAQIKYFLDSQSTNLLCGWPCSWNSPTQPLNFGGYAVPHEIGLRLLVLAAGAQRSWIDSQLGWSQILLGLNGLRTIQQRPTEFVDGSFFRFYVHRDQNGLDLNPSQVFHDPPPPDADAPSSDDNCLLAMSLMLVDRFAQDAQQSQASRLCRLILGDMNLRRFLKADGSHIAHYRSESGTYSSVNWDRTGAEGTPIAAAMACVNDLSRTEFIAIIDAMGRPIGHWRGKYFIHQADFHGAMFVRGVRAQAGCPISVPEAEGCNYVAGTLGLLLSHLDDMGPDEQETDTILSHVMTQTVGGVAQTGRCPGNESGGVCDTDRQVRSSPHAWFIPLARPSYLSTELRQRLVDQMDSYEGLYFHDTPGRRGWEAAVPLMSSSPYVGTDSGQAHEALNSGYICLSIYDAMAIDDGGVPLSGLHPAAALLAHAMAYVDSGVPLPNDFPNAYLPDLCAAPRGDCNDDGLINGTDIAKFVRVITGNISGISSQSKCAADINNDGTCDVIDVPLFVNLLLGS